MNPASFPPATGSGEAARGGETEQHRRLKALAVAWAREQGFPIAMTEVRVPRSGYRADVAAYAQAPSVPGCGAGGRPAGAATGQGAEAHTALFECKQARTDLLKDAHDTTAVQQELADLVERRAKLEALLAVHRPDLRRGEALFPEYDAWDFSGLEHKAYQGLLSRLATLQARRLKGTKFARMLRYRCADFLYLVVEDDIYAEAEIPAGWGLLVRRDDALFLQRKPARLEADPAQRLRLLEAIALAASTRYWPQSASH